ncbi:Alpha/beta hydrolase fold protein [Shewanella piezotolerans WP3]|uniref:Proline iminopeptidase n=1 Tax=Shewanella piezotolerans (strain WP3 / JCM 13877) TaxID=225849 RepID=B8CHJ5_SHEPW|nr:alpha/beta fold hydrolase [Shewanella piezotolerans]ACJ27121.1 Alpha/beta hydrolase fold protein [Shewanella piezotolerans WP3]
MTSQPISRDWLAVGDGHELYVAQYGNVNGIPLLYLHGGPGAGCSTDELVLFDLSVYRVIFMDQRGAGLSRPRGELKHNNLGKLLTDIEQVRQWLGLSKWTLAGGSFGATLALLYAAKYPSRVIEQVLWGAFIPSEDSIRWLYGQQGAARLFPAEQLEFSVTATTDEQLSQFFSCYRAGLDNQCASVRQDFTRRWLSWEMALAYPGCKQDRKNVNLSQVLASIELYYVSNNYFAAFEQLCVSVVNIQAKTVILQGELDWVCPSGVLFSFLQDHRNQHIRLMEIKGGYHALADIKMTRAVVSAIREMAQTIVKGSIN